MAIGNEDAALEPALRAAFRTAASSSAALRVAAEPVKDDDVAPLLPGLPERYAATTLLARGGVGLVYRGHDLLLDRTIAIKVLDTRHAERPALRRRFLREAQVCARLAHPGIVPVHDVGWLTDGRPWLTMKLVEGATLASLLETSSGETRGHRLVEVFAQVCRALAHANAQGVVHRDLKPANVMVGAFGEIQVMDWGMAKVLAAEDGEATVEADMDADDGGAADRAAASTPGSVMGTYAYMAPEQARGEIDAVGPAADVFGLGAILCQILTGAPPYRGSAEECREQAQGAALADAFTRLAEPRIEADLGAIAKRCLAPERAARPRDAGEVCRLVEGFLAGAADRVRAAELAQERAQARATAERRARRLTLLLALVTCVGLAAAAVFWWSEAQQRLRSARAIGLALENTAGKIAAAEQSPPGGEAAWLVAVESARRAVELAGAGYAAADLRARAEEAMARAESGARQAEERRRQREIDRQMLDRLDSIRVRPWNDWSWPEQSARFETAFRDYGIDVKGLSAEAAAGAIRQCAIAFELVGALSDWRLAASMQGTDAPGRDHLERIAQLADADPTRARIRGLRSAEAALAAESSIDLGTLEPATFVLLFSRLFALGLKQQALRVLRHGRVAYPGDFWIAFRLGQFAEGLGASNDEQVRALEAALAISPQSLAAGNNLAGALIHRGELAAAEHLLSRLVRQHPREALVQANMGGVLERLGRIDEALDFYQRAVELAPADGMSLACVARLLRRLGRADEALRTYERAVAVEPTSALALNGYGATLCDVAGRPAEAEALFRRAIELDPRCIEARANLAVALGKLGRSDEALRAADDVLAIDERRAGMHALRGQLLAEAGRNGEARQALQRAAELDAGRALTWRNLGAVETRLGDRLAALRAYRQATGADPTDKAAWQAQVNILTELSGLALAVPAQQSLVALDPADAKSRFLLGDLLFATGELEPAERVFAALDGPTARRRAAECHELRTPADLDQLDPGQSLAVARFLSLQGRHADALPYFERAIERMVHGPRGFDVLAGRDAAAAAVQAVGSQEGPEILAKAREWLEADLERIEDAVRAAQMESASRWLLDQWLGHPAFSGPQAQRLGEAWNKSWRRAEQTRSSTGERTPASR